MSNLTAQGRKGIRDTQRGAIMQRMRTDSRLAALPSHQRVTLSELKLIGRDLYRYIRERGVILPDGSVNPAVEAHRKNAQTQLHSLQVFMELNAQKPDATIDLVQLMSGQGEAPEAAAAESDSCVDRSSDDPEPETK